MARVSYTECRKMYQERKGSEEGHNYTVLEKRCPVGKKCYINLKLERKTLIVPVHVSGTTRSRAR